MAARIRPVNVIKNNLQLYNVNISQLSLLVIFEMVTTAAVQSARITTQYVYMGEEHTTLCNETAFRFQQM